MIQNALVLAAIASLALGSLAGAQSADPGTGVFEPATTSVATSSAAEAAPVVGRPTNSAPSSSTPRTPARSTTSAPRPTPSSPPAQPEAVLAQATSSPSPGTPEGDPSWLPLLLAGGVLLGGYAAYKKIRAKSETEDTRKERRCFDLKALLDRKLEELTDLKGKLAGAAEEHARGMARDAVVGTKAGELLGKIELLEKECARLKKMHEECIVELSVPASVKAVAFDVGGVIALNGAGNPNEAIARALGVPVEEYMRAYFAHNHLSNVEGMPWDEMVMRVVDTFHPGPETANRIRDLIAARDEAAYLNRELIAWFPLLRKAGYKVGILSNATAGLRPWLVEQKILEHVDAAVISGEIGHQKPHREAFQSLFDGLGVSPREVVFIDDSRRSLEKAREIGYMPILFHGNSELIEELEKAGVPMKRIISETPGGRV